jgi:hypothetical protein
VEVKEGYQLKISDRFAALKIWMMMVWTSIGLGKVLEGI